MTIDEFAPQVSFFFYTHGDFFEEIAKYRAGRRRWAQIVRERYGAQGRPLVHVPLRLRLRRRVAVRAAGPEQHRARRLRGDGVGARRRAVDVHRRVGRAVRAARARSPPRSRCARSRSSPTRPASPRVADPLGGSYYVEALTDEMEERVVEIMDDLERAGRHGRRRSRTATSSG